MLQNACRVHRPETVLRETSQNLFLKRILLFRSAVLEYRPGPGVRFLAVLLPGFLDCLPDLFLSEDCRDPANAAARECPPPTIIGASLGVQEKVKFVFEVNGRPILDELNQFVAGWNEIRNLA
jgi:hypothetical protein